MILSDFLSYQPALTLMAKNVLQIVKKVPVVSFQNKLDKNGSGRPEDSHLQSPTEPYVNLSTHTAHVSPTVETFLLQRDAERNSLLPVTWLASPSLS
jgi:hypothetical protein